MVTLTYLPIYLCNSSDSFDSFDSSDSSDRTVATVVTKLIFSHFVSLFSFFLSQNCDKTQKSQIVTKL